MDLSLGEYAYKKKPSVYAIESSASENEDKPPAEIEELPLPTLKVRKKRKTIVIDSESDSEPEVVCLSPPKKAKRLCIIESENEEDEDEKYNNEKEKLNSSEDSINGDDSLIEQRLDERVVNFLNTCEMDELVCVPSLSQLRATRIFSMRPFADDFDTVDKINSIKGYNFTQFYECCMSYIKDIEKFEALIERCNKISLKIQQETLTLVKDTEHLAIQQPSCIPPELELKHYQMIGLNWLAMLHEKKLSSILADQMGLGKTIQTLAFIAYLLENGQNGTILIVCPVSTLDNWLREFNKWLPDVSYITYTGNQEERRALKYEILNKESDVIITTYNMMLSTPKDRALFRQMEFQYLIMDEAHMMKNMNTERYKNIAKLDAKQKLLLTGTPLQNDIVELMSLMSFLMPDLFKEHHEAVKRIFVSKPGSNVIEKSNFAKQYVNKIKKIVKPFVLRRLKSEVLDDLPAKREEVCLCPLNSDQSRLYRSFISSFSEENEHGNNAGLGLLMNLRKVTNHHLLVRDCYTYEKLKEMARLYVRSPFHFDCDYDRVLEDMTVMSDSELHSLCKKEAALRHLKLTDDVIISSGKLKRLDSLLPKLKEQEHRVLIFSQFVIVLDVIEEFLKIRKHSFVRFDGSTKGSDRQGIIDKYNNNKDIFIFLLSTRSGRQNCSIVFLKLDLH